MCPISLVWTQWVRTTIVYGGVPYNEEQEWKGCDMCTRPTVNCRAFAPALIAAPLTLIRSFSISVRSCLRPHEQVVELHRLIICSRWNLARMNKGRSRGAGEYEVSRRLLNKPLRRALTRPWILKGQNHSR